MKTSQVIEQLQKALEIYGDLPLTQEGCPAGKGATWRVRALNGDGCDVRSYPNNGLPVEIFLEGF